jgi:5-methylcytosine-specific restriction endonuclease McrA
MVASLPWLRVSRRQPCVVDFGSESDYSLVVARVAPEKLDISTSLRRPTQSRNNNERLFMTEDVLARRRLTCRNWRKKNLAYDLNRQAIYRAANRERERLRAIAYRSGNPEKSRATTKKYASANPDVGRIRCQRRRAKIAGSLVADGAAILSWEKSWKGKHRVRCFWCQQRFKPADCQSDHIVPLSKGGEHRVENLAISCGRCNHKKYNHDIVVWNSRITEPVLL